MTHERCHYFDANASAATWQARAASLEVERAALQEQVEDAATKVRDRFYCDLVLIARLISARAPRSAIGLARATPSPFI